ncbi:TIR domain-containing protein [Rivihabitans pingtungensis]|uniref:TIR domain-containing protein n=1 Tax=Rivihabitans pingtungensis TaxID=1054498 RepID=UPI00235363E6|nr:toll/interleukin-1 receptor domain-containing protein [Rivihabitans pingtungensis]MCK6437318.1 toll/interleukin-1 receptor domain-containing protein [Rivihabitans pingtungensis]
MRQIFISYSHQDEAWKNRVVKQLRVLSRAGLDVWDDRRIAAGDDWHPEIQQAIERCDVAVLLISADFLTSSFILDQEVPQLLQRRQKQGIRVIPLIVRPCEWRRIDWLKTIQARPTDGKELLGMTEYELESVLSKLAGEIADLLLAPPPGTVSSPEVEAPSTGQNAPIRTDLTHLPAGAAHFLGRDNELAALDAAWASAGNTALVELIAPGGTGKTALVKRWLEHVKTDNWRGARRVFAWSFYSQGSGDERNASEDVFLAEAIQWFCVSVAASLNPADKGRALAEAIVAHRCLLVLDGLEPLQHPPGPLAGELRAPGLKALLTHLATAGRPGLALLTSREALKDLDEWANSPTVQRIDLGNLSDSDGAALLHAEGANKAGSAPIAADDAELLHASRQVKGHALTLSLLGKYLGLAFTGDIRQRDQIDWAEANAETKGGHAFRVIAAYERWFAGEGKAPELLAALRLLGFFDRPATPENLAALRAVPVIKGLTDGLFLPPEGWFKCLKRPRPIPPARWNATLKRLQDLRLLEHDADTGRLDAHPLLREYFAATLSKNQPKAWQEGHRRLYRQLKDSVPYHPEGLAGLQPLYQAVVHGCRAGLYQETCAEVYHERILRGTGESDGFYSAKKLGAFGADLGALACFFAAPWQRLAPGLSVGGQAWLLNQAAFSLRALGRLAEALEPMRAGAEMLVAQADWKNAAIGYNNLSQLQLSLGHIVPAVADAERSVDYADRSGDAFLRMAFRTTLADARHQQGEREAARRGFAEAETMQAEDQPEYPLLYSVQGFEYGELLLAEAERAAWGGPAAAEGREGCAQVAQRAAQALAWAKDGKLSLLTIALDHLTLARCALYADLLHGRTPGEDAQQHTKAAIAGLRQAGTQHHLPRGLLTRAWLRHGLNNTDGAQADLAEAQRIAERGGMKLHLADIALTRARLFEDKAALAKARALIEECGYGRRLPELEDAEQRLGRAR